MTMQGWVTRNRLREEQEKAKIERAHKEGFDDGYLAGKTFAGMEIASLRAKLDAAKAAIRWMHGYDEPGTEDFPICPEGKRFAWRVVARQQFAIVREACADPLATVTK